MYISSMVHVCRCIQKSCFDEIIDAFRNSLKFYHIPTKVQEDGKLTIVKLVGNDSHELFKANIH